MRYANKRMVLRSGGGQFREARPSDLGIGGVCENCGHFLLRHFDGDPRDPHPDPRRFRFRCFHCEPETEEELKLRAEIEAAKPKPVGILDILRRAS